MKGFCYVRALKEAQDIFGLDFDFDEFKKYGRDDSSWDEDEDEYEQEDGEDGALRRQKKKSAKKINLWGEVCEGFCHLVRTLLMSTCPIEKCNNYCCCPERKSWKK